MSDIAINPVDRRVQFLGNTGTGPFAFTFNILQSSDIIVYKNNVLLAETTDYTVTIDANGTGNVTMVAALITTDILTMIGGRELSRTTDFVTAGDLLASSLNEQLDSNVIMSQQLDERFGRTIKAQPGDEDATLDLPVVADRADKIMQFDTEGNLTAASATDFFGNAIVGANYIVNTATGDGSQTAFGLTSAPGAKTNIQVHIDGVYQNKATFSLSGSTLTFSEAPPLNAAIEFMMGEAVESLTADPNIVIYNQGGTGAQDRTLSSRLKDFISVKDFGATGDGSTNDYTAFVSAMAAGNTVYVPKGTYAIGTALTLTGHFVFDEGAKIKANAALIFNMSIHAGQYQIGEHGTGSIEWGLPHEICVEWFGLNTTNSAANNKTNYENFLKYSDPDTYPYVVKFGRGSYDYEAPFYVRDRITIEGQSMFASELDLQGSDVHGVETCQIVSNAILTDGVMYASANYAHMRNMEIECSDMTMTGTTKKFVYYAAALSSSIVENNRFDSPSSSQNQMDGIFLGPTAAKEISTYTIPTSGVNISTDEITYTDHGYLTGDAIKYQDGSGTALAGLTDNTQYFAIRVSDNVFQVASSLSNAQAGTEINLTGTGNNDQTFEYEGNDRARAANRTIIRENRINSCRDGIVLGRHNQSKTDAEPAGGGSEDNVGGACFENTIGPRNYIAGASGNNVRPRFGIVCHYYNQGSGISSKARPKPYANNIYSNTVLEFSAGVSSLSGTIAVSDASATVTGSGTAFTTELPNDLTSGVARKLAIGFTYPAITGTDYMFEVASIDSDTQITLKNAGSASLLPAIGTVSGLEVNKVRSGVGLYTGSAGQNIVFRDHYTDHWCLPMKIESNTKAASFYDNHHAGAPFLPYEDESASDSQVYVRYHSPIAYSARTNGKADGIDAELKYYKGLEIDRESGSVLTIESGAITALSNFHTVATEGGSTSDFLDNIYNGHVGQVLILGAADGGEDVVLRDGVGGNLRLAGICTLDTLTDRITLLYDGTNWNELARSDNG